MLLSRYLRFALLLPLLLSALPAGAQQSNGLTFYHLVDATTKDSSGNLITSIKAAPQTDGAIVAFESGSATTACDSAASLYTVPITGGPISTLGGPGIQVEPLEPAGTATVLCSHLVLNGETLFYPANYTPTGGSLRSGVFQVPLAGGASADVLATGDKTPQTYSQQNGPNYTNYGYGTITSVATTNFSVDPLPELVTTYTAQFPGGGPFTAGGPFTFWSLPPYGGSFPALAGPGITNTSSCPGVTAPDLPFGPFVTGPTVGLESGYEENAPWYINFASGTGVNYSGSSVPMQFIEVSVYPYFSSCEAVVFGPDLGSMTGNSTFILPGEPVPNSPTPVSTMAMGTLALSNGVIYLSALQTLSATQGTYSGIFTVADNFTAGNQGSLGDFPLPNGIWPASENPIPTKIISNYDPVPGITLGLANCPGSSVSQMPVIGSSFVAAGNYIVFTDTQQLQNCTTMAISSAGGTYAYNLTTHAVQLVAAIGVVLVPGYPAPTNLYSPPMLGSLSNDGHLVFVVSNTDAATSTTTQTLYSAYLPQIVTALSFTEAASTGADGGITLTAKVSPNTGAANVATGTVQFLDGATVLATQPIDATGTAVVTLSSLSSGSHALKAAYSGDPLYEGASSITIPLSNGKTTPVLTLTSPSTTYSASPITLTAQLSTSAGTPTPTGQIVFSSGGVTLGSSQINSTGTASLTLSNLAVGTISVIATYAGDTNFNAAVSSPDSILVLGYAVANLSPLTLTFPSQAVGTTSSAQTLTLNNFNDTPLTITSTTVSGDFAQTNNCGGSVAAGSICHIYVTFSPTASGDRTGTLTITSSPGISPSTVALNGTTLAAEIGSTSTMIVSSGTAGNYTLTGAVIGVPGANPPTGAISFLDTTNNNLPLGEASLGAGTTGLNVAVLSPPPTGVEPNAIVVGDFNGDGKLDMAVANAGPVGYPTQGGPPTIFLGKGDGTFSASTALTTASNPSIIAVGDFNGDGKLDLVVDGGANGALIILLGNGDGTFTQAPTPVTSFDPSFVAVGDFNGDGKADLAVANGQNSTVTVFLGNGDATFTPEETTYQTGQYPASIATADFNHDGRLDMAVGAYDNTITTLLNNGNGTFTSATLPGTTGEGDGNFKSVVAGDFNGDGKVDLVTSSEPNGVLTLTVLLGNGDGTFTSTPGFATDPTYSYGIAAADFNGDGKTDIAIADNSNITLLLSKGDGTFTIGASTTGSTTGPDVVTAAVGDFNGDGVPDLAATNSDLDTVEILLTQRTQTAVATLNGASVPGSGTHNILASYAGDANFTASTSSTTALTASQIATGLTLTSSAGTSIFGTPLTLTAMLNPYSVGSLATTGESVTFYNNGTTIGTSTLTSGIATLSTTALSTGSDNLTATYVGDPNFVSSTAGTQVTVNLPNATATITAPATTPPGSQPAVTFALGAAYPVPLVATFTLNDKSGVASGATDPAVQFATGGTTYTVTLPAGTTTLPALQIQAGTIAATITVPVTLTANGVNVTPANLAPATIAVPAATPTVTTTTLARSGNQLTVTETGFSNTREIVSASFHFVPVAGATLTTTDFTAPVTTDFATWFASPTSLTYGSAFSYVQVFNVSDDSSKIASVQVTLTNSVGVSTTQTAQ
jgi:hypothetical protein